MDPVDSVGTQSNRLSLKSEGFANIKFIQVHSIPRKLEAFKLPVSILHLLEYLGTLSTSERERERGIYLVRAIRTLKYLEIR